LLKDLPEDYFVLRANKVQSKEQKLQLRAKSGVPFKTNCAGRRLQKLMLAKQDTLKAGNDAILAGQAQSHANDKIMMEELALAKAAREGTLTEEQKKQFTPQQLLTMAQETTKNTTKFKKAALRAAEDQINEFVTAFQSKPADMTAHAFADEWLSALQARFPGQEVLEKKTLVKKAADKGVEFGPAPKKRRGA